MHKLLLNIWSIATIVSLVGTLVSVSSVSAAIVTSANDYPTSLETSTVGNHRVIFTTPTGVSEGATVAVVFSTAFDTSTLTEDDVDIADDGVDLTTASDCSGAEQASISIASDVVTIVICAGDGGAIAASSEVVVEIGTNATSSGAGANQTVNPPSVGTYFVTIQGTFGDTGSIAIPISSDDNAVGVSVAVPAISSGGSGGGDPVADSEPDPDADTTEPVISNIVVSGITETVATITWSTSENATSMVDYGLTQSFELGTESNSVLQSSHSITLTGLTSGKQYYFRVRSVDASSNVGTSSTQSFTTLDLTAPTISDISVTDITPTSVRVTWATNEVSTSVVEYGLNVSYGASKSDASMVTSHSVTLTGLTAATQYHFRVRSVDTSANSALSGDNVFTTAVDAPPSNVSGLTITSGDGQLSLSWSNPSDSDLSGIRVVECTDATPSGPTDTTVCSQVLNALQTSLTRTGLTNGNTYYYGVFAYDAAGQFASGAVGSGIPTASEEEVPTEPEPNVPSEEPTEEPSDEPAGDTDGEPQETESSDEPGSGSGSEPTPLGAGKAQLEAEDLEIIVANGQIVLSLGAKGAFDVLPGTSIRFQVVADSIAETVETLQASIGSDTYLLRLADQQGGNALYFADVLSPQVPQLYVMSVSAEYKDGSQETVSSFLNVVPWGTTVQVIDAEEAVLPGVKVTLEQVVDGKPIVWDGSPYDQFNPLTTGPSGTFGWYVPNGTFNLLAHTDHFLSYESDSIAVNNHIANSRIVMVAVSQKPNEEPILIAQKVQEATIQITQKIEEVLKSPVTQTVQQAIETVRESKTVQKTVDIATPTIAVTAGASIVILAVAFDFLPFLQYLFTAPVLLLWRRKRKGFGVVYNATSRLPIDLAVVRLYLVEDETKPGPGRLLKSRVTDKGGRFFFLVQPGTYRVTATKAGFRFPTDYLKDSKDDGTYLDVYHGETIRVTDKDAVITPNIPIDSIQTGQTQVSSRVVWQGRLRGLQQLIGVSGVIISLAVAFIRPSVLAAGMIGAQVFVYLLAHRLAKPRKPKNWGIVYDKETNRPLANVVARIFEPKYNKLLDTQVTDAKGRYAFLLGPREYFAVFEKPGYRATQVRPIDLSGKEGSQNFGVDVELHPSTSVEDSSVLKAPENDKQV